MSNEVLCAVIIFKVSSHFVQVIIGRHFNLVSVPDPLRLSGQRRERSGLKPINYSLLAFSLRNFAKLRKEALFLSFLWSVISVALGVFSHQNSRENDCTHTAWVLLWRDRQIIFNPHCSYGDLRTNFITKLQSVKNCEKKFIRSLKRLHGITVCKSYVRQIIGILIIAMWKPPPTLGGFQWNYCWYGWLIRKLNLKNLLFTWFC